MSQTAHRGRNQAVMQPVWVILHAVAGVTGSHPRRLVPPQACARGMTVPWPRHGAYRQPGARGGGVAGAPGVEPSVWRGAQSIDRLGGAVGLWTIIGGGAVGPTATPLHHPRGHRPAARRRGPRRQAPQTRGTLPWGRGLRALPGPLESLAPPRTRAGLLPRPERGENAPPQRARGQQRAPRLARGVPASGADRARVIRRHAARDVRGTRAIAPLPGLRRGGLDHAHAQDTAAANSRRDVDLWPCHPGQRLLGHQLAGPLRRRCDRGADKRRAAAGPPGPLPAQGSAAEDGGQGGTRPPHWRRARAVSTAAVRAILDGMTNERRRVKTAPVACHVLRRTRRSGVTDTAPSGKGKPWSIKGGGKEQISTRLSGMPL